MTEPALDVSMTEPPQWAHQSAAEILRPITGSDNGFRVWRRSSSSAPVLRISDKYFPDIFDLRAVEMPYLLEFERCRFEHAPDLRQAKLAGVTFQRCWLPGLRARNLRSANDITLFDCTVDGASIDLTDANIGGSLVLERSRLHNPGGRALHANRLVLAGALLAARADVQGELRVPGLRVGGNINLRGATLHNPPGLTLNANAAHIAGNLLCNADHETDVPFVSSGLLYMTSARIGGDLVMRGARLTPKQDADPPPPDGDPYFDVHASLVADRMELDGNALFDIGLRTTGTLRMVNARVGGSLRLAGATLNVAPEANDGSMRALNLDATKVSGDLNAANLTMYGQARMVDVEVRGSVSLESSTLDNAGHDVIEARRFTAGGNLDWQGIRAYGSILLQGATIGANVDLRGSVLTAPGSYSRDTRVKPSFDVRAAAIGRDLLCSSARSPFHAEGGVRMHSTTVGRSLDLTASTLGTGSDGLSLNAIGASAQEMIMALGEPTVGTIAMRHARCGSLGDNEKFWQSPVELDDFVYDNLSDAPALRDDRAVRIRLAWLHRALRGEYRPGAYDQLAAVLRKNGNEEHAATVLIEKQRQRYSALARGFHVLGTPVRAWSWLQRWMVGYGYRPMRALVWLLLLLAGGTLWFALLPGHCVPDETDPRSFAQYPLCPITNQDDHLVWNPFLLTLDLLVPIVDFGNKDRWSLPGHSQWIATILISSGWILATTVAAGATRMLRRQE